MAKITTNCLKISRTATFGQSSGGHNLAIFYPILTTLKWSTHWDESNGENI